MIDGPLPAGDTPEVPAPLPAFAPGAPRPLSGEDLGKWTERIERGERKCKQFHEQFDRGLANYMKAKAAKPKDDDEVDPKIDYRHVESKKSQLYHRTPDVMLTPIDPTDGTIPQAILSQRQKLLNYELGPKGANAKRAVHKTLVETLAASGWMITMVGFEQITLPDPVSQQQIPVWSRRFISTVSAKKLIVPDDFLDSSDFDSAPWLAVKGTMPLVQARRLGWYIPPEFEGSTQSDDAIYKHTDEGQAPSEKSLDYTIVWYRAALYDEAVFNPDLFRCLILAKGLDQPAWHIDSPFQGLTPEGALTDDSMIGNPIHVGTLRDLPDSAHVPADLIVVEPLSMELKKFRTSLVRGRRQRRPLTVVSDDLGQPIIDKLTRNEGPIVIPASFFDGAGGQRAIAAIQVGTEPRDNFTAQDYLERDYEQAVGMSANQGGQFSKQKRTATEVRTVQGNSSARAETEKDRIREYVVALFRKFDAILQKTATIQEVTKILGQQGAALWQQWAMLPGKYAYDIVPDSGQYVDAEQYRSAALDSYNLLRKDERVSPEELLARVARAHNMDPAKLIAPPKDKTTEPPVPNLSFKGEDAANPAMGNLLLDLLANAGIKLRPETIQSFALMHAQQMAQAAATGQPIGANADGNEHGGSASVTEPVNQHQTQKTGKMQGMVQ